MDAKAVIFMVTNFKSYYECYFSNNFFKMVMLYKNTLKLFFVSKEKVLVVKCLEYLLYFLF